ncbi:MAG: tetratricopeptide repeat protein [Polyangiaceae bacterium]
MFGWNLAHCFSQSGDVGSAVRVLEEGLEGESPDTASGQLPFVLARLLVAQGKREHALRRLEQAIESNADLRVRARSDEGFAALRGTPEFEDCIREPVVDAGWLDAWPVLARLRDDEGLRALGLRFVDEASGRAGGNALRAHYASNFHLGTLWTEGLWSACQAVAAPLTLLATGPKVPGNRSYVGLLFDSHCYVNLDAPDSIWNCTLRRVSRGALHSSSGGACGACRGPAATLSDAASPPKGAPACCSRLHGLLEPIARSEPLFWHLGDGGAS